MIEDKQIAPAQQAFIRAYRSFGMLIKEMSPTLDVTEPNKVNQIWDNELASCNKLGANILRFAGAVDTANFDIPIANIQFVNISHLLPDWLKAQKELVNGLSADLKNCIAVGSPIELTEQVDDLLKHAKASLAELQSLKVIESPK